MEFVDLALGQGDDPDIGMPEALVDGSGILLVATNPVQRFRKDNIEATALGSLQEREHTGSVSDAAATDSVIGEDIDYRHAIAISTFLAQAYLILDRSFSLIIRTVAGVDSSAH
jgi:hypothetical protein